MLELKSVPYEPKLFELRQNEEEHDTTPCGNLAGFCKS